MRLQLLAALLILPTTIATAADAPRADTAGSRDTASAPSGTVDPAIDRFMSRRGDKPIWLGRPDSAAVVQRLALILRRAPLDGLATGPRLATEVEAAARDAASGDAKAVARSDRMLSAIWLNYVAALSTTSPEIAWSDPSLAPVTPSPSVTLWQLGNAPSLLDYIDTVSAVNPMYATLRDAAWANEQRPGARSPSARLMQNLARARALPRTGRYVVVDAATQRLSMVENGRIADSMKVIVGTHLTPTPMLASTIWYITVNPYWYVPPYLTKNIVAGRMMANPGYLKFKQYEVISDFGEHPTMLSPVGIDWKAVQAGTQTVYLRQLPGEKNSMGRMKFSFPSDTGVYLHDTDLPQLFAQNPRTLSNGCVRLEDAARLGRWMMGREVRGTTGAPEEHQVLPRGVPVFLTYLTAQVKNGEISYLPDPYGRDIKS